MKTAEEIILEIHELPPEEKQKVADYLNGEEPGFYAPESQKAYRQALKEVEEGKTHPVKNHEDLMKQLAS
ncbi:MAG: hypothetical protein AB1656_19250 [Candidatus Omnitrophota bacterium]